MLALVLPSRAIKMARFSISRQHFCTGGGRVRHRDPAATAALLDDHQSRPLPLFDDEQSALAELGCGEGGGGAEDSARESVVCGGVPILWCGGYTRGCSWRLRLPVPEPDEVVPWGAEVPLADPGARQAMAAISAGPSDPAYWSAERDPSWTVPRTSRPPTRARLILAGGIGAKAPPASGRVKGLFFPMISSSRVP